MEVMRLVLEDDFLGVLPEAVLCREVSTAVPVEYIMLSVDTVFMLLKIAVSQGQERVIKAFEKGGCLDAIEGL